MKTIAKIENIPYCGDLNIEGYWNENYTEVKSYEGGWSPELDADPHYFRASWKQSKKGRGGEYRDMFSE